MFVFSNLKNTFIIKKMYLLLHSANEFLLYGLIFLKEAASTSHTQQMKFNNH